MSLLVGREEESSDMQAVMSSATQAGHSSGTLQVECMASCLFSDGAAAASSMQENCTVPVDST